jgi:hypothetical protein
MAAKEASMNAPHSIPPVRAWPEAGPSRVPYWAYSDPALIPNSLIYPI